MSYIYQRHFATEFRHLCRLLAFIPFKNHVHYLPNDSPACLSFPVAHKVARGFVSDCSTRDGVSDGKLKMKSTETSREIKHLEMNVAEYAATLNNSIENLENKMERDIKNVEILLWSKNIKDMENIMAKDIAKVQKALSQDIQSLASPKETKQSQLQWYGNMWQFVMAALCVFGGLFCNKKIFKTI